MSDKKQICTVEKFVDLGITIDSSLSFCDHIINIVREAHGACCQIFSAFQSRNIKFMAVVLTMYVRSILEYGCHIWNPHFKHDGQSIKKVFRRFSNRIPELHSLPITSAYQQ